MEAASTIQQVRKRKKMVRRRKAYSVRRDFRFYVFIVILGFSIMVIVNSVNAVFN